MHRVLKLISRDAVLFGLITAVCIAAVFSSTIFSAKPISRLSLVKELDALYNKHLLSSRISVTQDPSACLQQLPRQDFIQQSLKKWDMPFWNPLSGCGQPLIADPANGIWNFLDITIPVSNQYLYNLGLLAKIMLCGLCAYMLFVRAEASKWAAASSAVAYALCPFILHMAELPTLAVPAVFLCFSFFRSETSALRLFLCSLGLSTCYSMMHPEVFFIAVISATALFLLEETDWRSTRSIRVTFFSTLKLGAISILLVSPLLLPFLEYMKYAHSYKYGAADLHFLDLQSLSSNLLNPQLGSTLHPGIITLFGFAAGSVALIKKRPMLFVLLSLLTLFECRPYPLNEFLARAPFSYILPEYLLGTWLLLFCLIASLGLTELYVAASQSSYVKSILLAGTAATLTLAPVCLLTKQQIDSGAEQLGFRFVIWSIILTVCVAAIIQIAGRFENSSGQKPMFAKVVLVLLFLLPVVNTSILAKSARKELPYTETVSMPPARQSKLLGVLQSNPGVRITACGEGLMVPSTGLFYGLRDFRTCTPLNESRYIHFVEKMNARLGYCNMIEVPTTLNHLADMASLELLVTGQPIHSTLDYPERRKLTAADGEATTSISSTRIIPGLRINNGSCIYRPKSAEIECNIKLKTHLADRERYLAYFTLSGEHSECLWRSPPHSLSKPGIEHEVPLQQFVPVPTRQANRVKVELTIQDAWTGLSVHPDGNTVLPGSDSIVIGCYQCAVQPNIKSPDGRFELLFESPDLIRVYHNINTMPRAYLVDGVIKADSPEAALKLIQNARTDWKHFVVLEDGTKGAGSTPARRTTLASYQELSIAEDTNTRVVVDTSSEKESMLVLTDLFFPGWEATIDGKTTKIIRANYIFRAVKIPLGKHRVVFHYSPLSLGAGIWLQIIALSGFIIVICCSGKKPH